jgi:glycosyltransferase involved in cell wall biosynthesis
MVVISKALKKIYLEKGYLNESKIQVAHDGADSVENLNNKIELLGEKKNLKVGYVGHLYKGRGVQTIIDCAKNLNDMTFHLVGGLTKDIEYWKSHLKKLNIENVYFYGFVSPIETIKYRNSFDIFLAPYEKKVSIFGSNESDTSKFMSPLKIFEYMSHKKPIIASDLPVIREVLNESNSLLVECANKALIDFSNYSWNNRAILVIKY